MPAPHPTPVIGVRPAGRARAVFLPKEHGSWFLAGEPVALGLGVAPSAAGVCLGVATLALFLARRPVKGALFRADAPEAGSRAATLLLAACAAVGLAETIALAGLWRLWPLAGAIPLGGWFLFSESRGRSRDGSAELAGSAAFAFVPAALAVLAGHSRRFALVLAAVMAARSLPAVYTVRSVLRAAKGPAAGAPGPGGGRLNGTGSPFAPVGAAALALILLATLALRSWAPWPTAAMGLLFLARARILAGVRPGALSATRLGTVEAVLGGLYVAAAAVGYHLQPASG